MDRSGPIALDRAVKERFSLTWGAARAAVRTGKVFVGGVAVTDPTVQVATSVSLELVANAPRPHVARRVAVEQNAILHVDTAVVVVNKPAGTSTVPHPEDPSKEEAKVTLDALVRDILSRRDRTRGRAPLGIVHRLDRDTTGVLVFARTVAAKRHLAQQFREHTVERRYLAIVHGIISAPRTIRSYIVEDRGDGLRGSARPGQREGQLAVTHVKPLTALAGATLISCELETGRTHQIRVHLSEAGHPLVGERVYIRNYPGAKIDAPRMMLHAAELGFVHPLTEEDVHFSAEPPQDFQRTLRSLQRTPQSPEINASKKGRAP